MITYEQQYVVSVNVATLWTSPESPRELDLPALQNPAQLSEWLRVLGYHERLELCEANKTQTQVLFGTIVHVEEEAGDWVKVLVSDQPTLKNKKGYPGWMPRAQLTLVNWPVSTPEELIAVVQVNKACLYVEKKGPVTGEAKLPSKAIELELSYLTELPVVEQEEMWVRVQTPIGERWLLKADVSIRTRGEKSDVSGELIVHAGRQFLGLPYLWAGTSSFGYDCSGFAYSMHKAFGKIIPRDASNQAAFGQEIPLDKVQPGDLLFFAYEQGKGAVHHVAISLGGTRMLHAPKTGRCVEELEITGHPEYEPELCIARRYWHLTSPVFIHDDK
ncbi:C40 family peptidase [Brevibacillus sp. 7WMA2]|uniref:C40 family peptidase n=1 Tax=Brevibacillus sp. 7WMA2 TaxID=2683193 RepID=UPI0013A7ABB4|nr:NlpC/P60 family protein [Brevibacillus sp. 7WMA2]QIC05251.1 C40 family peptidase [Brevibacillus sp. 7WMA2]